MANPQKSGKSPSFMTSGKSFPALESAPEQTVQAPGDRLDELTQSVTRLAALMEAIAKPLTAYFEDQLPGHGMEEGLGGDVEELLAASPIAPMLADDTITDIFINGPKEIYVNRGEKLEKSNVVFPDSKTLRRLAKAIAGSVGRSLDPRRPLADARLKDGSRVNIIAPPMAVGGLSMSIRKFPQTEFTLEKLVAKKEMSQQLADFLKLCAECRVSLLISGGTGTGKTTLLNAVSRYIPATERIITIEDTAELRMQQPHVVRLETKEPHILGERKEEVNASDLVRNALRMRPDRIVVGEVRGEEAYDMIQALNTGHDGSMTTVHANTPRDAFTRLENLIAPRLHNTSAVSIRRQIVSAINLIVQLTYHTDGTRMVTSVTEIVGMEGEIPTMQEIFTVKTVPDENGMMRHTQEWTKIIPRHPRLSEKLKHDAGIVNEMIKEMA